MSYIAPCSCVFVVLFSIVITSLGDDRAGVRFDMLLEHLLFILFSFSLPLGVMWWLRLAIVALSGLFSFNISKCTSGFVILQH